MKRQLIDYQTMAIDCPALVIDRQKLEKNTRTLVTLMADHGVEVAAVTKCYCGDPHLAKAQVRGGATMVADSRMENLKKLSGIPVPKMLLRIPMLSQVEEVVEYADISLNSELAAVQVLSAAAQKKGKTHQVILMVDIGDLREGCLPEEAVTLAGEILKLPGIRLVGIGANYSCFGGVQPDRQNLGQLVEIKRQVEERYGVNLPYLSGGNSVSVHIVSTGEAPEEFNLIRLGEAILLGIDGEREVPLPGTSQDVFTLVAEVVELATKPSKPIGTIGKDAFGNVPEFPDLGLRKRAILAIGRQDVKIDGLRPRLQGSVIVGGSSDHMIVDVTDCKEELTVGDRMEFDMNYGALLALCTSAYVTKKIL